ncbi:bifunctional riboflavin kinase/FAD synthetase [Chloroflexota bacterium]
MLLERVVQAKSELAELAVDRDTVLTVGVFDGVHLGHQHLLNKLKSIAADKDLFSGVVTFKRHPLETITPDRPVTYLTSLDERLSLLEAQGINIVVPLTFDKDLANLNAKEFVLLLKESLRMKDLFIGPDFTLGKGQEGNAARLTELGKEMDFTVDVASPFQSSKLTVSSTAIRQALADGDMKTATRLLGRHFSLNGPVIHGDKRGRVISYPTANLNVAADRALPPDGVYTTIAIVDNIKYDAVTNVGMRPTFNAQHRTVEVFLLNFHDDLYGKDITIELVEKIRPELKFSSANELSHQIEKDVQYAKNTLAKIGK